MKLTKGIKEIFVKKLKESITSKVTTSDFNEAFIYLDRWNNAYKTVPYSIFEEDVLLQLEETEGGVIFKKWLDKNTSNIEKDFNKSRKVVRLIKDIKETYKENLAFNLSANTILMTTLTVFFVQFRQSETPFRFPLADKERFEQTLSDIRSYLATIFFIELVDEPEVIELIVNLFVNGETEVLIDVLIEYGLMSK